MEAVVIQTCVVYDRSNSVIQPATVSFFHLFRYGHFLIPEARRLPAGRCPAVAFPLRAVWALLGRPMVRGRLATHPL